MRPSDSPPDPIRDNPYFPHRAVVSGIEPLIDDHLLFRVKIPTDSTYFEASNTSEFAFNPGQFVSLSAVGCGESPISISHYNRERREIEFCIRNVGRVTKIFHRLTEGAVIGIRGPFGNGYPLPVMRGKRLIVIAGGLGMAPLRSLVKRILEEDVAADLHLFYGTKTPATILFADELYALKHSAKADVGIIVEDHQRDGRFRSSFGETTGFATSLIERSDLDFTDAVAAICGPPNFYRFVIDGLLAKGMRKENIFMSLERRMECGIGKCGHCTIGYRYTCIDGPIFNYWDAYNLPEMIY